MMATKRTSRQMVDVSWVWTSDTNNCHPVIDIATSANVEAARQLIRIGNLLERIETHILSLGRDGLHEVIRHEAERVRKIERLKRARAKEARARARAAKLAKENP